MSECIVKVKDKLASEDQNFEFLFSLRTGSFKDSTGQTVNLAFEQRFKHS